MSRRLRIALWLTSFLAVAAVAVISVGRSDWFAEKVRSEVVRRLALAAGGRVEITRFNFDWHTLRVELDGFVIHGREPAGAEPLLSIVRTTVDLRIVSLFRRDIDVAAITASNPRAHFMIFADGSTNLPARAANSRTPTIEDLLALKVGRIAAENGLLIADRAGARNITPWNLRAENLTAHLTFDAFGPRYTATLSASPLNARMAGYPELHASVEAAAEIDRDAIRLTRVHLAQGKSQLVLTGVRIAGLDHPDITGRFQGNIAIAEFAPRDLRAAGDIDVAGDLHFSAPDYRLAGTIKAARLDIAGVKNVAASGDVIAAPAGIDVQNLSIGLRSGVFRGRASLDPRNNVRVSGKASNFSAKALADALSVKSPPWDALIAGDVDAQGTLGTLREASAHLTLEPVPGGPPVHGQVAAVWNGQRRRLDLGHSSLQLPSTSIEVSGAVGERLSVDAETSNLADLSPFLESFEPPFQLNNGSVAFAGDVEGPLDNPRITGRTTLRNAVYRQYQFEFLQADIAASRSDVTARNVALTTQGMEARATFSAALADWRLLPNAVISGSADLPNADLRRILNIAHITNIDATGTLRASARFSGTVADPRGDADLTLTRGLIVQQPYDSITAHLQYLNTGAQTLTAGFVSGPKRVNLTARRSEPVDTFPRGRIAFEVTSNSMALNQIALVRTRQPDIDGAVEFKASGAIDIGASITDWHVASLEATGRTTDISLAGRNFGNTSFSLNGQNDVIESRFDSDAVGAIHGDANVTLHGDYPATANLSFTNVDLNSAEMLVARASAAESHRFQGIVQGKLALRGPLRRFDEVTATLDIPQIEFRPAADTPLVQNIPGFTVKSAAPIHLVLSHSTVRLDPVRLLAPETELTVDGTLDITRDPYINARLRGTVNMGLARNFVPDLESSGSVVLDAAVRGTQSAPLFSGRATIRGGEFHYAGFNNGLNNVAGDIVFNGPRANIQSLTGETGGGKVNASGFAALTGNTVAFRLDAKATSVRVRYPEGVSSVSDVTLTVAGTSGRSEASGSVFIHRLAINPKADLASILATASGPQPALALSGLMANMNLDIQVATAPDVAFETDVAQGLQADANLRLRGTAANPALLGRVNVSHGELSFFGNKYTISQGAVSFFNTARIEPVLNLDLSTKARGVEVILTITGPPDRLNMSYRSDPPLEFGDIINLLATGRTPSDQTVASRGTGPTAGFEQMGAGALLGQALANPVAGRLQRFFGVSRLKIDPTLTGVTGSPQARLTIEQQVTPDILFTYITDVAHTNNQLVRVEWAINRQVSAILVREENGYVGMDFAWKKRFK